MLFSKESYDYLFANPWTMKQGVVVISLLFLVLMGVTGSGWGASQPYGIWFGKILMIFGFTSESLSEFTKMSAAMFERPFFQDQISVQNFARNYNIYAYSRNIERNLLIRDNI